LAVTAVLCSGPSAVAAAPDSLAPAATWTGFPDWVESVAFSPDGKSLVAGSYGVARFYSLDDRSEVASITEKAGSVRAVAFSPDSRLLATGSYQTVAVWDTATHQTLRTLKGHRGYVTAIAFSPDGKTLVSASEDETVKAWDAITGAELCTYNGHSKPVTGVAFSHDGRHVASCSGDVTQPGKPGQIIIWDVASGEEVRTIDAHDRAVTCIVYSPDDRTLATGSFDESVKLWDATTGQSLRTLEGHGRPVTSIAFLSGDNWLAAGCGGRNAGGNKLTLWDAKTGKPMMAVEAHTAPVNRIAASTDNRWIATAGSDKVVRLWDVRQLTAAASGAAVPTQAVAATTLADAKPADKKSDANKPDTNKPDTKEAPAKEIRIGIIGLDTSHVIAFTKELNAAKEVKPDVAGCRIVAAYAQGSKDIPSSTQRVAEYTKKVKEMGVEIVESIDELLTKVDAVLLESNDGRPHYEQVLPVLKAGKPVFIDKPIAGSLADAIAIFEAARHYKVPVFSSSSLRFSPGAQALRNGKIGEITGCDAYSPCSLQADHPDLFWYGIHGVETLFTVMGTGCENVSRVSTPDFDVAVGTWKGGRIGTFRGIRKGGGGYGGTAFGTKGVQPIGGYGGYRPLVVQFVEFFRTGKPPVSEAETLEIYAFMEAADESKRQGGAPVTLDSVMTKARAAAKAKAVK